MAALSDATIMAAIKTLIEGDGNLYHVSTATLVNKVYTEGNLEGHAQRNYCEIMPPGGSIRTRESDGIKTREMGDAKMRAQTMGNSQETYRPFTILITFKQIRKENNTRIYDWIKNFRNAIKADETLSTSGVDGATVTSWGYKLNKENQTITDGAGINLRVQCTETF